MSPNGIILNSYSPSRDKKAVFDLLDSSMPICQYPDARSMDEYHLEFSRDSNISSIRGSGYASLIVTVLSRR